MLKAYLMTEICFNSFSLCQSAIHVVVQILSRAHSSRHAAIQKNRLLSLSCLHGMLDRGLDLLLFPAPLNQCAQRWDRALLCFENESLGKVGTALHFILRVGKWPIPLSQFKEIIIGRALEHYKESSCIFIVDKLYKLRDDISEISSVLHEKCGFFIH